MMLVRGYFGSVTNMTIESSSFHFCLNFNIFDSNSSKISPLKYYSEELQKKKRLLLKVDIRRVLILITNTSKVSYLEQQHLLVANMLSTQLYQFLPVLLKQISRRFRALR